ncbi:ribonuclease, Rne/Rng family [Arthrobacter crystallopoietes BAB-32]|uniref:Ribonuclease E n=1 Tax=Arthrobacter crystallopoietes BAB-32 TaxID=1246476 RepID=N1V5L7_9MICC|nr:ribonuclease E/G [Arthrobacter crystallopoietes]EMY35279.1 ribonuclease, Rne/Rng family [Arthrobacter crystallopoietes BAB-32]
MDIEQQNPETQPEEAAGTAQAPAKRAVRTRRKVAVDQDLAASAEELPMEMPEPPKTRARRTRKAAEPAGGADSTAAVTPSAGQPGIEAAAEPAGTEAASVETAGTEAPPAADEPQAKARTTRRRKAAPKAAAPAAEDADATGAAAAEAPAEAPAPPAEAAPAGPDGQEAADAAEPAASTAAPARTRRTRTATRKTAAGTGTPEPAATEETRPATGEPAGQEPAAAAPVHTEQTTEAAGQESAAAPAAEAASQEPTAEAASQEPAAQEPVLNPFAVPESPVSLLFHAPDLTAVRPVRPAEEAEEETTDEEEGGRRRSRRNRRSKAKTRVEGTDEAAAEEAPADEEAAAAPESGDGVTARRRRRRRRGDQDMELSGGHDDDPPNTITRVRAPRPVSETAPSDRVSSVKGSTRLEAKKQRRRESRESGRRRQVITEAEFLARRESVDRQMVVRQREDRIQIAVLEDGVLAEHFVSKTQQDSLIGNVYLGKVQNVLPSMEAAFVDIGRGRNAVLYAGEVNWDAAHLDGQPRRIENALKSGDSVLVQVTKDPVGHKGARLTSQISLPGRFLVYVPGGSMTGISRKLPDVERNRLKKILKEHVPDGAGVIVRTAAEGASEEELMNDINRLRAQWEEIERRSKSNKTLAPEMLYAEPDLTIKVVRDVFNEDFSKLIVSGEEAWDTVEAYVTYVAPDLVDRLEKWVADEDIFAANRIDEQIHKALERKVFLPSGGSLVIDRTEAMTVVDVNTGKFTGSGGNLEETVTKNNLEAAEEVVRQLRLRDIGGIIVIDFIDMVLEANRDLVLRRLVECLGRDRTKHQVAEVTSLGLVQMTRKRMGTGLLEVFGESCEHCGGRGVVTHDEPIEHRRAAVAAEHHQHHLRTEKPGRPERPSRSEKRRNRNQAAAAPAETSAEAGQADEAERQAKAQAARAALANIAAAAQAAHEAEDHAHELKAEAEAAPAGPVLTINGEEVALPRAEHSPAAAKEQPALTLANLTEAFDRVSPEAKPEQVGVQEIPAAAGRARDEQAEVPEHAEQAAGGRRRRRHRAATRPQGAANAEPVQQRAEEPAAASGGTTHSAAAPSPAAKESAAAAKKAAEPVILGVGVPASEL